MNYCIKSEDLENIIAVLKVRKDIRTGHEENLKRFISGICYVLRTGIQWRFLPKEYGSWRAVHKRFKQWSDKGIWKSIFESCQKNPDLEYVMVDSTIVRAHACAAGYEKDGNEKHALGRSKGGFTTKIHALCDALGNPLKFILTQGQRNDITKAEELIFHMHHTYVLADKGYDSNSFIENIKNQKSLPVIPPKRNRKIQRDYDQHVYKERHLIECFFGKMKHFRRVCSRFDKAMSAFMSFIHLAGALIWLR